MSRYDREDLSHLDLPEPDQYFVTYYTAPDGNSISKEAYYTLEPEQQPIVCGKITTNKESGTRNFFVLCSDRNELYDPRERGMQSHRNRWRFVKVKRTVFDLYMKFLNQRYQSLLKQAERGL